MSYYFIVNVKTIGKRYFPLIFVFLLGFFVSNIVKLVIAHGGNTNFIHACVKTSNGNIRIVGPNDSCASNESPLDWSQNGIDTFGGFTTNQLIGYTSKHGETFNYRNFSGANFTDSVLWDFDIIRSNLSNTNFSNSQLLSGVVISSSDFSNANFTDSLLDLSFEQTNLTNANFTNADITEGTSNFFQSNLTNANFTNANLTGVTNLDTSTRTGIIWSNTICPDGTNSDANGYTCEEHLTP